jgi:hypothetical protein
LDGKQVFEVPPSYIGGSPYVLAVCSRGIELQKVSSFGLGYTLFTTKQFIGLVGMQATMYCFGLFELFDHAQLIIKEMITGIQSTA